MIACGETAIAVSPYFCSSRRHFDTVSERRTVSTSLGGGPRQCIGNELTLMEIKMILIRMVQLYRFELASKFPVQMNALSSLQPRGGVWVKAQQA